jgi:hypothetical protein
MGCLIAQLPLQVVRSYRIFDTRFLLGLLKYLRSSTPCYITRHSHSIRLALSVGPLTSDLSQPSFDTPLSIYGA